MLNTHGVQAIEFLFEEISIDDGAAPVNTSDGTITFLPSFSRAQYGTTIVITPTIHDPEHPGDDKHFVTLETNVTFDTIKKNVQNDRPAVSKRHVENHVRVVDGETVILGGLREKTAEDTPHVLSNQIHRTAGCARDADCRLSPDSGM